MVKGRGTKVLQVERWQEQQRRRPISYHNLCETQTKGKCEKSDKVLVEVPPDRKRFYSRHADNAKDNAATENN